VKRWLWLFVKSSWFPRPEAVQNTKYVLLFILAKKLPMAEDSLKNVGKKKSNPTDNGQYMMRMLMAIKRRHYSKPNGFYYIFFVVK
jgi:hypothetical protein